MNWAGSFTFLSGSLAVVALGMVLLGSFKFLPHVVAGASESGSEGSAGLSSVKQIG